MLYSCPEHPDIRRTLETGYPYVYDYDDDYEEETEDEGNDEEG